MQMGRFLFARLAFRIFMPLNALANCLLGAVLGPASLPQAAAHFSFAGLMTVLQSISLDVPKSGIQGN